MIFWRGGGENYFKTKYIPLLYMQNFTFDIYKHTYKLYCGAAVSVYPQTWRSSYQCWTTSFPSSLCSGVADVGWGRSVVGPGPAHHCLTLHWRVGRQDCFLGIGLKAGYLVSKAISHKKNIEKARKLETALLAVTKK